MVSKRDQLQAYQFLVQRTISALVTRETDPEQPPFRRPSGAVFASIAVAIVSLACVGVYGMIVPGGNDMWRDEAAVIVEKETGTRYVYLEGRLHPVANYTSALLLIGDHGTTRQVSRNSLVDVPRGPRIGIPDAPDALPDPDRLLTGSWSLCSAPASDLTGSRIEESVLLVGAEPTGGAESGDAALLVESVPTGDRFMVWRGRRHRIDSYDTVVGTGLALTAEPWARVGKAWLDVLPEGDPIGPLQVADLGQPSTAVPGRTDIRVGMLLVVQTSGGAQHYLAERDTLRPITPLQHDIQLADAQTMRAAYPGAEPSTVRLAPSEANTARRSQLPEPIAGAAPVTRPSIARLRDRESTVCATFDPGTAAPGLTIDPALPPADPMATTTRRSEHGTPLADRVYVPPGRAAVVEAMPSEGAPMGTLTVVTDMGRRYPLASPEVLRMLGYSAARPVRLPAGLVARLPEGSGLDPNAATRQVLDG